MLEPQTCNSTSLQPHPLPLTCSTGCSRLTQVRVQLFFSVFVWPPLQVWVPESCGWPGLQAAAFGVPAASRHSTQYHHAAAPHVLAATRLTAEQALAHPWLASLHDPNDEPSCPQVRRGIECPLGAWQRRTALAACSPVCRGGSCTAPDACMQCPRKLSALQSPPFPPPALPTLCSTPTALQLSGGGDCGAEPAADPGRHSSRDVPVQP